jgi:hypothetical protein
VEPQSRSGRRGEEKILDPTGTYDSQFKLRLMVSTVKIIGELIH